MRILGLSAFKQNPAAAVLENGLVKAAIENDKLARVRSHGLPMAAIQSCLERAGTGWEGIDRVAVATRPLRKFARKSLLRAKFATIAPIAAAYYQAKEVGVLARDLNDQRLLHSHLDRDGRKVISLDHHLCHAANAFFMSPFDRALIVTMDEDADGNSTLLATGEGSRIRVTRTIAFPHSVAWVYSLTTDLIGFTPRQDEQKTQWLSLEGEPVYKDLFLEMLRARGTPLPRLNYRFFTRGLAGGLAFSREFYRRVGLDEGRQGLTQEMRQALACSVQRACTEIVSALIAHLRKTLGIGPVCLSGGLFQNSLLVAALEETFGVDQVFVPPAPGNPGSAVGAALLVWHQLMQNPRSEPPVSVFWGPKLNRQEVKEVLDNCKARYSVLNTEQRKIDATVQLLEGGKVVGWYQGAAEFGPRALGNRSVLASPWAPYVKENLNDFIKKRESFRPFAIAVPEEDCGRFFVTSRLCRFMNSLGRVREGCSPLPESFCLPGGLIRLQVVERRSSPLLWSLLKSWGERSPAPLLLNTSFNLHGEPLVMTARDALRSYFCSGLDALVIDNFFLSKTKALPLFATNVAAEESVRLRA